MPEPLSFHRFIRPHDVPREGKSVLMTADAAECEDLARALDLASVEAFSADVHVMPLAEGLRVQGELSCSFNYRCVVTLEPFAASLRESFDQSFRKIASEEASIEELALFVTDDPPEPLTSDGADIGAILAQFLSLALDPYPRRADSIFSGPAPDVILSSSPFAVLAHLKPR